MASGLVCKDNQNYTTIPGTTASIWDTIRWVMDQNSFKLLQALLVETTTKMHYPSQRTPWLLHSPKPARDSAHSHRSFRGAKLPQRKPTNFSWVIVEVIDEERRSIQVMCNVVVLITPRHNLKVRTVTKETIFKWRYLDLVTVEEQMFRAYNE